MGIGTSAPTAWPITSAPTVYVTSAPTAWPITSAPTVVPPPTTAAPTVTPTTTPPPSGGGFSAEGFIGLTGTVDAGVITCRAEGGLSSGSAPWNGTSFAGLILPGFSTPVQTYPTYTVSGQLNAAGNLGITLDSGSGVSSLTLTRNA